MKGEQEPGGKAAAAGAGRPLEPLDVVRGYHEATKHHTWAYARSLGYLDWETQPDPFRRYPGAPLLSLQRPEPSDAQGPRYDELYGDLLPARPVSASTVAQLLFDSLALSAWKQARGGRWSLRVNPSSGNLHPTEGYLVAPPLEGLHDRPAVHHYAPHEHALELRCELEAAEWQGLAAQLPPGSLLLGLSSIWWRESWKYGERAFRYCQHDLGHAVAAVAVAAAILGWEARVLESVPDGQLAVLLGLDRQSGPEAEHPEALLALVPGAAAAGARPALAEFALPPALLQRLEEARWLGTPNRLSADHFLWPIVDAVAAATEKRWPVRAGTGPEAGEAGRAAAEAGRGASEAGRGAAPVRAVLARRIVRQRRSAVDMDGQTRMGAAAFYRILARTMPGRLPFAAMPWAPQVHLGLFVHRVDGLEPGLYLLARDRASLPALREACRPEFAWTVPEGCPPELPLVRLRPGDVRSVAQGVSCGQEIAAGGVFAVAMLAGFEGPLQEHGAWFYRRLHWEAGAIGQVLYLEAEAAGIRSTGIGCFFDDSTHQVFGLQGRGIQDLYHFTVGGPVEDPRLQTLPAYDHLAHR